MIVVWNAIFFKHDFWMIKLFLFFVQICVDGGFLRNWCNAFLSTGLLSSENVGEAIGWSFLEHSEKMDIDTPFIKT